MQMLFTIRLRWGVGKAENTGGKPGLTSDNTNGTVLAQTRAGRNPFVLWKS